MPEFKRKGRTGSQASTGVRAEAADGNCRKMAELAPLPCAHPVALATSSTTLSVKANSITRFLSNIYDLRLGKMLFQLSWIRANSPAFA